MQWAKARVLQGGRARRAVGTHATRMDGRKRERAAHGLPGHAGTCRSAAAACRSVRHDSRTGDPPIVVGSSSSSSYIIIIIIITIIIIIISSNARRRRGEQHELQRQQSEHRHW